MGQLQEQIRATIKGEAEVLPNESPEALTGRLFGVLSNIAIQLAGEIDALRAAVDSRTEPT